MVNLKPSPSCRLQPDPAHNVCQLCERAYILPRHEPGAVCVSPVISLVISLQLPIFGKSSPSVPNDVEQDTHTWFPVSASLHYDFLTRRHCDNTILNNVHLVLKALYHFHCTEHLREQRQTSTLHPVWIVVFLTIVLFIRDVKTMSVSRFRSILFLWESFLQSLIQMLYLRQPVHIVKVRLD